MARDAYDLEGYSVFILFLVNNENTFPSEELCGVYSNSAAAHETGKKLVEGFKHAGIENVFYTVRDYTVRG